MLTRKVVFVIKITLGQLKQFLPTVYVDKENQQLKVILNNTCIGQSNKYLLYALVYIEDRVIKPKLLNERGTRQYDNK